MALSIHRVFASLVLLGGAASFTPSTPSMTLASGGGRRTWLRDAVGGGGALLTAAGLSPAAPAAAKLVYFPERSAESYAKRVRKMAGLLDELQRDLAEKEWEFIEEYPGQFRSYVPAFTKYTDTAFPDDTAIDKSIRFAMRYEVGKLFGAVDKLKKASGKKDLAAAQAAFAEISLAYDRYLKSGNLYEGDASQVQGDATADVPVKLRQVTDPKKKKEAAAATSAAKSKRAGDGGSGSSDGAVAAVPAGKPVPAEVLFSDEAPAIGDAIVLVDGPEKGKVGTLLGIQTDDKAGNKSAIIKTSKVERGFREILVVKYAYVGKALNLEADAALIQPR